MRYEELPIEKIELDLENPRIQVYLSIYKEITSETISLALSGGADNNQTGKYRALRDSIKQNRGIFTPIIVNYISKDNKYVVVEGNTRVKFYQEFLAEEPNGPWNRIMSIVYDDMSDDAIHSIRLQAHMVGPRDWDAFSKAKYLDHLYNVEKKPMEYLRTYCGGQESTIRNLIDAYNDMITYYNPMCEKYDMEPDTQKFSYFVELQRNQAKDAIVAHGYDLNTFSKWIIDENIDRAETIRKLARVLGEEDAKKTFLSSNLTEAIKKLDSKDTSGKALQKYNIYSMAHELTNKLSNLPYKEIQNLQYNSKYEKNREYLSDLKYAINDVMDAVENINE